MTRLPRRPDSLAPLTGELALGIARDMEDIADRIGEMKSLSERQMAGLADAAAAAAGIADALARHRVPAASDATFLGLRSELSHLEATVEAQVKLCRTFSRQFLEIARSVGAEVAALRQADAAPAGTAPVQNVVWLSTRRGARDAAATQAGAVELRLALQEMRESAIGLLRALAESGNMIVCLCQRMRSHRRRTRHP